MVTQFAFCHLKLIDINNNPRVLSIGEQTINFLIVM